MQLTQQQSSRFEATAETHLEIAGEVIPVRAFQVIVWVSVKSRDFLSAPFPAVLDTGMSHNFYRPASLGGLGRTEPR
jgi:hypothetical protein